MSFISQKPTDNGEVDLNDDSAAIAEDFEWPSSPRQDEDDPLPEYCRYQDEGCELSNSCLNCPFPKCIYDVPGGIQRYQKDKRAREIIFQHGRGKCAIENRQGRRFYREYEIGLNKVWVVGYNDCEQFLNLTKIRRYHANHN